MGLLGVKKKRSGGGKGQACDQQFEAVPLYEADCRVRYFNAHGHQWRIKDKNLEWGPLKGERGDRWWASSFKSIDQLKETYPEVKETMIQPW
jgi:hypothetical protein